MLARTDISDRGTGGGPTKEGPLEHRSEGAREGRWELMDPNLGCTFLDQF